MSEIIYPELIELALQFDITALDTVITLTDNTLLPDLNTGQVFNGDGENVMVDDENVMIGGDWFYITFYGKESTDYEVCKVLGVDKTNNTITVVRGINNINRAFTEQDTVVLRWTVKNDWQDLRLQIQLYAVTQAQIDAAVVAFLTSTEIQALVDGDLTDYELTINFETKISDFRIQNQIQDLINISIQGGGYSTATDVQLIAINTFDEKVETEDLQSKGSVDNKIDEALDATDSISQVSTKNNGEGIGKLSGSGTSGDPLLVDWDGEDPSTVDDVPANTAHRQDVTTNPHGVTALQARSLTIDTPDFGPTDYTPTLDAHPATKILVDEKSLNPIDEFTFNTANIGNDSGTLILGQNQSDPTEFYIYAWQRTSVSGISSVGEGEYLIPLFQPLNDIVEDIHVELDVINISVNNRIGADMNVYIVERTVSTVTIVLDVARFGFGLNGNNLVVRLKYYGNITI